MKPSMQPNPKSEAELFDAALDFPNPRERAAYLDKTCAGRPELRQRVDALLAAHDKAAGFLEVRRAQGTSAATVRLNLPAEEKPGDIIGRYKLLQKIGEGGCGVVYMAEQETPVRRRVALKVIKLGMDTKEVVARFEAERQALALMDHPNIAKVLDAGATTAGRPYFVMELVKGIPATRYADENKLDTRERLDLFIQICQAVQHAHQKGIIHRDIKPSNILVADHDGVPVPKVIDFGIAKATTDQRLTDKTLFTALEQFVGTPAYMSPEQAKLSGLDIDTRSDIYSLGVLLYELLTGKTPFDPTRLFNAGFEGIRRIIREEDPPRPSACLSTLAHAELTTLANQRRAEPPKLLNSIRGDLDWIVMKCLEKDRTRRYETASGLAADVQRHLGNEPVVARPPSASYRFQKMVRRNRFVFASAACVLITLIVGIVGTTLGLVRAERHRRNAEATLRLAQENFEQARAAVADLLAVADEDLYDVAGMQPLRVKLMRAAIDRYKGFLDRSTSGPGSRADLARLYVKYGFAAGQIGYDYEAVVLPAYKTALAIQESLVRQYPNNRDLRFDLGYTYLYLMWGRHHNTVSNFQSKAVAIFEGLVREAPADPLARADYARALGINEVWETGHPDCIALMAQALQIYEQLVREFPLSAEFRRELAYVLHSSAHHAPYEHQIKLDMLARANQLRAALVADMEQRVPEVWLPARPRDSAAVRRTSLMYMKRDVAFGHLAMAGEHAEFKEWSEVRSHADRAAQIYRPLVENNPLVGKFADEIKTAFSYGLQAVEAMGDEDAAKSRRQEAADFWRANPQAKD